MHKMLSGTIGAKKGPLSNCWMFQNKMNLLKIILLIAIILLLLSCTHPKKMNPYPESNCACGHRHVEYK